MPLYALATYVLISIFSNGIAPNAHAQFNTALTDKTYHEPWELHNKVFEQLSTSQLRILQESSTAKVDRVLIYLDTDAKYFEKQVIEAINHMFGLPNFTEIAGDVSFNWSETLIRVDSNLKLIYAALGIQGEVNVLEAHRATQTLIDALAKKRPFERDVLNSLGRGVKNLAVDMANRWWISSEGLTKLVAKLKEPSPKTLE
jgi:hypothetical protein